MSLLPSPKKSTKREIAIPRRLNSAIKPSPHLECRILAPICQSHRPLLDRRPHKRARLRQGQIVDDLPWPLVSGQGQGGQLVADTGGEIQSRCPRLRTSESRDRWIVEVAGASSRKVTGPVIGVLWKRTIDPSPVEAAKVAHHRETGDSEGLSCGNPVSATALFGFSIASTESASTRRSSCMSGARNSRLSRM